MKGGFNPCCVGSVASTVLAHPLPPGLEKFQSLLCWIGRVNSPESSAGARPVSFQSLLCWIGRVNAYMHSGGKGRFDVSILVVLDRSRQHPDHLRGYGVPPERFNPCCVGSVASTWDRPGAGDRPPGFNPCCVGSVASTRDGRRRCGATDQVSILVVLDRSRQPAYCVGLIDLGTHVSILVVLDRSRQPGGC